MINCYRFLDQRPHSSSFTSSPWRPWWKTCSKEKTDSCTLMAWPILERLIPFRVRSLVFTAHMWMCSGSCAHSFSRQRTGRRAPASGLSVALQEVAGSSLCCHGCEASDVPGCAPAWCWRGQSRGNPENLSSPRGEQSCVSKAAAYLFCPLFWVRLLLVTEWEPKLSTWWQHQHVGQWHRRPVLHQ